jgi:Tfp pilus assembly protein PilN
MKLAKTDNSRKSAADASAPVQPAGEGNGAGGGSGGGGGAIRVVAAAHERDGAVFAAVGRLPEGANPFRLTDTRRFSAAEHGAIRGYLKDSAVDLILRVAPAGESLARSASLPDNIPDGSSLAEALALIAESELPSQLPWYRRTGGRFRTRFAAAAGGGSAGGGGGGSAGLLIGWHRRAQPHADPLAGHLEGFKQLWTTESVALAGMLPLLTVDPLPGTAPRWIAFLDPASGVLALVAAAGEKSSARVLRLPADESRRTAAAAASLSETLASLVEGEPATPRLPSGRALLTSSSSESFAVAGQTRDPAWLDQFAIPAALLGVFADPDPAVRSLFNLHAIEPRQRLGLLQGVLTWLSSPTRAAAVIAACVAALLLVPLGVAYARHQTLRQRVAAIEGLDQRLAAEEQRVAFYSLLRERRWPMTKLMADIATSTPEGITLEVLELTQGESITLRGTAKSNDLVTTFRENLAKTRVFEGIATPTVGSSAEGVQFQLQARVSQSGAIYRGNPIDDFAKNPLGKRLYGDAFTAAAASESTSAPAGEAGKPLSDAERYPGRHASTFEQPARGSPTRSSGSSAAPAPSIPPVLSDADIAKLDRTAAMKEFASRKKAASQQGLDAATKQRLLDEADKARVRMTEATGKGPGA